MNVIPLNPVDSLPSGQKTTDFAAAAERFTALLQSAGVEAALRHSRGDEVAGACGQLRRRTAGGAPLQKRK